MSQKLNSIQEILTSLEKQREVSFNEYSKILVKNKLNPDNFNLLRFKYVDIHKKLKGVTIFTSFWNLTKDYIWKVNLYKSENNKFLQGIKNMMWHRNEKKSDLYTIFKIENGEEFIKSLFLYIDDIKKTDGETFSKSIQKDEIKKLLDINQKKFGKDTFSFEMTINKYFKDNIEYYNTLLEENIKITNISIFEGKIKFYISRINIQLKIENQKSKNFSFIEKSGYGILSNGDGLEYKFKKGFNTFYLVKESFNRNIGEKISFSDIIEIIKRNKTIKDKDENKMIYNGVGYANEKIQETFGIEEFFSPSEKAYVRRF